MELISDPLLKMYGKPVADWEPKGIVCTQLCCIDVTIAVQKPPTVSTPTSVGWTRGTASASAATTTRRTGHGLLLVNNDDSVAPGSGFGTHAHRDMEIVTWVLAGELAHQDSTGHTGVHLPRASPSA